MGKTGRARPGTRDMQRHPVIARPARQGQADRPGPGEAARGAAPEVDLYLGERIGRMFFRPGDVAPTGKGTDMARGLNKVQIIGNLGADPEMRSLPTGAGVTNFRVAVSRNRRGNDGNMAEETEWFRCVAFDSAGYKLAEICHQYLRKGQKVYVEGRLH